MKKEVGNKAFNIWGNIFQNIMWTNKDVMMETFIVLGFCFILYEALDFFQSCYGTNNRHQHQHPQFNKTNPSADIFDTTATTSEIQTTTDELSATTESTTTPPSNLNKIDENSSTKSISTIDRNIIDVNVNIESHVQYTDEFDLDINATIKTARATNSNCNLLCNDSNFSSDSIDFNGDIITDEQFDDFIDNNEDEEYDSDETIIHNPSKSNVYSICDRVNTNNHQQLIDYAIANKNANFDDFDKLIVG